MKPMSLPLLLLFSLPLLVCAAEPVGPAAATQPEAGVPVLLMPFAALGDVGPNAWIGRGIQQNLLSELGRLKILRVLAPPMSADSSFDLASVRTLARQLGVSYVIMGSFQIGPAGIRITGNILDMGQGAFISGLKATGSLRDLFALEDTVAEQARRILLDKLSPPALPDTAPTAQPDEPAEGIPPVQAETSGQQWQAITAPVPYYGNEYRRGYYNYIYTPAPCFYPYGSYCYPWAGGRAYPYCR